MRRLLALAAVVAIGVVAMPAGAESPPPQPTVADHELTADGEIAEAGFVDEVAIADPTVGIVGLKWDGDADADLRVLVENADGLWVELEDVEPTEDGPDPGSEEALQAAERRGSEHATEPLFVEDPRTVRVEVADGAVTDVELVTVTTPTDEGEVTGEVDQAGAFPRAVVIITLAGVALALMLPTNRRRLAKTASMMALVMGVAILAAACESKPPPAPGAAPPITTRAQWGANEGLRRCGPTYANVHRGIVHHTAGGNSYSAAQGPGIVRGIYQYHVQSNGWCDIGYNFLVDRHGRIYEGRFGGMTSGVVGAHAAGWNTGSFGVAVMGNFQVAGPTNVSVDSLVSLVAWKMRNHGIDPASRPGGRDAILGHRDVNATACPGQHLYGRLGEIRNRVRSSAVPMPFGNFEAARRQGSNVEVIGWGIDPTTQAHVPVHVYIGGPVGVGTGIATTANRWRPDVGAAYPGWGNNRGFSLVAPISGPHNQACVYLISTTGGNTPLGCRSF